MTDFNSTAQPLADCLYRQIVEICPFGVLVVGADFRIRSASAGAHQALGSIDSLVGQDLRDVLSHQFALEISARLRHTLLTGEPFRSRVGSERRRDGRVESYDWSCQRIGSSDGSWAVACHFYDLSELLELEAALRAADRRKDEWITTLAHELRSPLAPVAVATSMLRVTSSSSADVRRYTTIIERQTAQMTGILDDLLDVSRFTRGALVLDRSCVSVKSVIDKAVETSRPAINAMHQTLTVTLEEPLDVEGDEVRLTQVVVNLLNNAAKYGDKGGDIALHAGRDGGDVVIRVRDSGVGIPPHMLERIFELFERGDNPTLRTPGLGIGLSLARQVVTAHGGTIAASSSGPGRGAEFVVRLPAANGTGLECVPSS